MDWLLALAKALGKPIRKLGIAFWSTHGKDLEGVQDLNWRWTRKLWTATMKMGKCCAKWCEMVRKANKIRRELGVGGRVKWMQEL